MAKLYRPSGSVDTIEIPSFSGPAVEAVQRWLNGYFEVAYRIAPRVGLPDGEVMLVNEEGKPLGLPVNREATRLYQLRAGQSFIVGNAVVMTWAESKRIV